MTQLANRYFDRTGAIKIDEGPHVRARVYARPIDAYGSVTDETIREAEDMASLFCAAPDLLAACERAERRIRAGESGPTGFVVTFPPHDDTLSLLRAVIAKATR